MKIEQIRPEEIERRSFEIITDLLGEQQPPDETAHIVKRAVSYTHLPIVLYLLMKKNRHE